MNKEDCFDIVEFANKSIRYRCQVCSRHLSSKQRVLDHLHSVHNKSKSERDLGPIKRANKRYLDNAELPVPDRTVSRWKRQHLRKRQHLLSAVDEGATICNDDDEYEDEVENPSSSFSAQGDESSCSSDTTDDHQYVTLEFLKSASDVNIGSESEHTCSNEQDGELSVDLMYTDESVSSASEDEYASSACGSETNSHASTSSEMQFDEVAEESPDCPLPVRERQRVCTQILSFLLRNNLSTSTGKDMIDMLKKINPDSQTINSISLEDVWKFVDASKIKDYHYCVLCDAIFADDPDDFICTTGNCEGLRYKGPRSSQLKKGRQARQSFEFADVKYQLESLLQSPGIWEDITTNRSVASESGSDIVRDISDGVAYKRLMGDGGFLSGTNNLTATFNTDGVNLYSSTKIELWPIFLAINELSPSVRFARNNMLLVGMWQGKGKPPFASYMNLFSKNLESLYEEGIEFKPTMSSKPINIKLAVICGVFDLPAKASILNMTYYNGAEACITCEEPGVVVAQGKGHSRHYPFRENASPLRTDISVTSSMTNATATKRVKGFKGKCGLCIKSLSFTEGIVPDYMHGVLLGVTKALLYKWFSPKCSRKPFFIGKSLKEISRRLQSIKPLEIIERLPRDLEKHYMNLKATELQSWLLFYGLPCVHGILPDMYLKHFASLSEGIFILLGSEISSSALERAEYLLREFYANFADLYGEGSCGLNVHNIGAHLVQYVRLWGPIWAWSCFGFEDSNAMLLQSVHGTGNVTRQVMKTQQAKCLLRKMEQDNINTSKWKKLKDVGDFAVAGAMKPLAECEIHQLDGVLPELNVIEGYQKAFRVLKDGNTRLYSEGYSRMKKRICSVVLLDDGSVVSIKFFLIPKNVDADDMYAVVDCYESGAAIIGVGGRGLHLMTVSPTNTTAVVEVNRIDSRLIFVDTNRLDGVTGTFVARLPNVHGHGVFK